MQIRCIVGPCFLRNVENLKIRHTKCRNYYNLNTIVVTFTRTGRPIFVARVV